MSMTKFLTVVLSLSIFACGSANVNALKNSPTDESLDTRQYFLPITGDLLPCFDRKPEPNLPLLQIYLYNLAKHITANNPDVFSGPYSLENFCLEMSEKAVGADTAAKRPHIRFQPTYMLNYRTDAEAAATMAHELGHVVNLAGTHLAHEPALVENSEYRELAQNKREIEIGLTIDMIDNLEQIRERLPAAPPLGILKAINFELTNTAFLLGLMQGDKEIMEKYWDPKTKGKMPDKPDESLTVILRRYFEKNHLPIPSALLKIENMGNDEHLQLIAQKMDELREKILGTDALVTSDEVIADISGFNFFLKSGFKPLSFTDITAREVWTLDAEQYGTAYECMLAIERGIIPERISKSPFARGHTSQCWRLYNMRYQEIEYYKAHQADLLEGTIENIFNSPSLRQVQEEIRRFYLQKDRVI